MKTIILLLLFSLSSIVYGKNNNGIGVVIGKPSGITFNTYFKNESFLLTLSWKSSNDAYLAFDLDKTYLFKKFYKKEGYEPEPYFLYYGFGVGFKFDNGSDIYIRIPLGVKKDFDKFGVFLQTTPKLKVTDETKGDLDIFLGGVYYF